MGTGGATGEVDEYEQGLLYDGGGFRITPLSNSHQDYNLWVGGGDRNERHYFPLPLGTLPEIAESASPERAREMMDNMTQGQFSHCLGEWGLSAEGLVIACARAKIKEWEEMFHSAARDAIDYRVN